MLVVDPKKQKRLEEANQASQHAPPRGRTLSSSGREGNRDLGLIKDRLAEFFIPGKLREQSQEAFNDDKGKGCGQDLFHWTEGFQSRGKGEINESCRHAFTAACHLLLESTTFPVYYTEKESQELHSKLFENTTGTFKKHLQPTRIMNVNCYETEIFCFFF